MMAPTWLREGVEAQPHSEWSAWVGLPTITQLNDWPRRLEMTESERDDMLMTTLGLYTVAVYNHRKYMVGMAEDVVAWTAREAYFNVMNDMPPHETYYVRRTANLEERESSDG